MPVVDSPVPVVAAGWRSAIDASPGWIPTHRPTLVVVPHPDDESLSTGGLIAHLRRHGVPVIVLAVTDGGAAYPDDLAAEPLERLRRGEQRSALGDLGVSPDAVVRVGIADGAVPAAESMVRSAVERLISSERIEHVVAPWSHDHHSDHEACGRAATLAAEAMAVPITYGVFWAVHRTADPDFGSRRLVRLRLDPAEREAKRRAIGRHRSQIETHISTRPVLTPEALSITTTPDELFIVDGGGSGGDRFEDRTSVDALDRAGNEVVRTDGEIAHDAR